MSEPDHGALFVEEMRGRARAATPLVTVPGTWSWKGAGSTDWWSPGSPWWAYMASLNFEPLCANVPFVWTTHLSGMFWERHKRDEWEAAALALRHYLDNPFAEGPSWEVPLTDRRLVAHSHGLQVVLLACSPSLPGGRPLHIHRLISVGSPVREDLLAVAQLAKANIDYWLHISSPGVWADKWQICGALWDGAVKWRRRHPVADLNDRVPKIGHSGVLRDPKWFHLWRENGWGEFLRM